MQLGQPTAIHHIARRQDQQAVLAELDQVVVDGLDELVEETTATIEPAETPAEVTAARDA